MAVPVANFPPLFTSVNDELGSNLCPFPLESFKSAPWSVGQDLRLKTQEFDAQTHSSRIHWKWHLNFDSPSHARGRSYLFEEGICIEIGM